jgi:anti-sigma regulatory factor (Ser/Thr protein kinase)/DNA-binding transcriptional ArsR family regulator
MIYANQTEKKSSGEGISIKVAVYLEGRKPEISEVSAASPRAASGKFSTLVMEQVKASGGCVPEEALRELIENLIHAEFRGVVISVLEDGNVVRISDKGPGIENKEQAFEFGFSGAVPEAVREIRGVGAGLGLARAAAKKAGGMVTIEDNIGGGTVVTISMLEAAEVSNDTTKSTDEPAAPRRKYPDAVPRMNISERQQKVLITVLEYGEVGPSTVAERLEISVSTAYRDLSVLEEHGLVVVAESGKRAITPLGHDLVEAIVNAWVK